MAIQEFGVLNKVDLREIWPAEARDFTPWLAGHIGELGEALGMDLELLQREAPVGGFSLDLLARDLGRDRLVVIENQLAATDHDHLGKLLTYAAGHSAGAVVWIAKELREEHRQALDWLNQRTDRETDFFGVVVEVLRIDKSKPAYNFRLVTFPNEWRKGGGAGGISPRAEAYRAFFQDLIDRLREEHRFTGARAGQPQNWYSFASGFSGISYGMSFAMNRRAKTEVYIDIGNAEENKSLFEGLMRSKQELEKEFGEALEWEPLDEKKACRVALYRAGSIEDDPRTRDDIRDWAIDRLLKFKSVFGPALGGLLQAG